MAIKFSQFNTGATVADIDFIVGYKAADNVQIPIGLVTVNTTYSIATAQDGANESLTLTGVGPSSTDVITFTAGANITLTDDGAGNGFTIQAADSVDGSGTANVLSKWSDADTLTDSILTETAAAGLFTDPYISVAGAGGGVSTQNLEINGFLLDSNGQKGTAGQLLSSTGTLTDWVVADTYTLPVTGSASAVTATLTGTGGDTDPVLITGGTNVQFSSITAGGFTIDATDTNTDTTYDLTTTSDGSNVDVNLVPSTGSTDTLKLTPAGGLTIAQTSGVITIDSTAVNGTVTEVTSANTNLLSVASGTTTPALTAVTGAVSLSSSNLATGTQIQTAINSALSSALIFIGGYDAATNTPVLDSRGTPIAISIGDTYIVSTGGTFYGNAVTTGETLIATADKAAGSSSAADWTVIQPNIGLATASIAGISSYPAIGGLAVDSNGAASIAADGVGATELDVTGNGSVGQALLSDGDGTMSWGSAGNSYTAGSGITLNTLEFDLDAALTTVTSIHNTGLVIGRGATDDYISFATDNQISSFIGNAEKMRLDSSFDLQVAGDVIAASTAFSDERLKENIKPIENPLESIKKLNGVTYDWKENGKSSIGVIAQNIQEVYPELVKEVQPIEGDEKRLTVNYDGLIGVLIETVKELSAKIDKLENK